MVILRKFSVWCTLLFSDVKYLMAVSAVFALLYRLITMPLLDDGGDQKYYMDAVRNLFENDDPYKLNHWSARMAIVIPVGLSWILTCGTAAGAYLVPVLFSVLAAVLIVRAGDLLNSRTAGFTAAVLFTVYPAMIRGGTQILPGIFSTVYLTASFCFLMSFVRGGGMFRMVLSALFMFFAYETHIINLFFAPGMLMILLFSRKYREYEKGIIFKALIVFCGVLFGCYVFETVMYIVFTDQPMGRLGVITASHLTNNRTLMVIKPWEMLWRFAKPGPYFFILFLISVILAVKCFRSGKRDRLYSFLPAMTYFIVLLCALKSFDPLIPAISLVVRYMDPSLPFIALFPFVMADEFLKARGKDLLKQIITTGAVLILAAAAAVCHENLRHPALLSICELDRQIDAFMERKIPFVYSGEDSEALITMSHADTEVLERINESFVLNKSVPMKDVYENAGRVEKNVDYINAFFADKDKLKLKVFRNGSGREFVMAVPESSAGKDFSEYLADDSAPVVLTSRRPTVLKLITAAEYRKTVNF